MDDDTQLVFDFEINVFKSSCGEMHEPFINIGSEMIHDDELKRLLKSDKEEDKERRKELITTIVKDYRDVFKYILLNGYKLDEILNDKGQTAFHLAFHHNPGSLLEPDGALMVDNAVSNINYTDSDGLTHLHVACVIGNKELVKKLLKNKSTNVNADYQIDKGDHGKGTFKPLHFAVLNLHLDIVKLLLENGADVRAADYLGRTPLHLATSVCGYRPSYCWKKDWRIVEILLKYQSDVNILDKNGNAPLLSIYANNFQSDVIYIYRVYINDMEIQSNENMKVDLVKAQCKKLHILLKHGADVSIRSKTGDTIIHCVINNLRTLRIPSHAVDISFNDAYHTKMVEDILSADLKLANVMNHAKESPLQLAVSYLSYDIVKLLLKYHADLTSLNFDEKNQNYFQYLFIVPDFESIKNLISIKELLLSKGYNMSPKDKLVILRFLVHNFDNCRCGKALDSYDILSKIMNVFNYGSIVHIKGILKDLDINALAAIEDSFNLIDDKLLLDFVHYLKCIEYVDLYLDKQVQESINNLYLMFVPLPKLPLHEPKDELRLLKRKKLKSNASLHEVLMKHPHDIYRYIKGENLDDKYFKDFPIYKNIIKGHFTKSIIRHHVEQSMYEYIQENLFSSLPNVCYHKIFDYLTNEDILNAATAVLIINGIASSTLN